MLCNENIAMSLEIVIGVPMCCESAPFTVLISARIHVHDILVHDLWIYGADWDSKCDRKERHTKCAERCDVWCGVWKPYFWLVKQTHFTFWEKVKHGLHTKSLFYLQLHGAIYGSGIYLSPLSSISFGYSGLKIFFQDVWYWCVLYLTICTIKQKKYYTYIFKNLLHVNMLFLFILWLFRIGMNKKQQKVASKDETAANKTNINLQVLNVFHFFFKHLTQNHKLNDFLLQDLYQTYLVSETCWSTKFLLLSVTEERPEPPVSAEPQPEMHSLMWRFMFDLTAFTQIYIFICNI